MCKTKKIYFILENNKMCKTKKKRSEWVNKEQNVLKKCL
jgi:hypothetical protein